MTRRPDSSHLAREPLQLVSSDRKVAVAATALPAVQEPCERAFRAWSQGDASGLSAVARDALAQLAAGQKSSVIASEALADLIDAISVADPSQASALAETWQTIVQNHSDDHALGLATLGAVGEAQRLSTASPSRVATLERAIALPEIGQGLRVRLLSRLAAEHHAVPASATRLSSRSAVADALGKVAPLDMLRALSIRYSDAYELVTPLDRNLVYQSCARDAATAPSPLVRLRVGIFHLDQCMALGFFPRFDELVGGMEELALTLSDSWSLHHVRHRRADRAILAGDFETAEELIREGLGSRSAGPDQFCIEWWIALSVLLSGERGDDGPCPPPYLQLLRKATPLGARCAITWHDLEIGRRTEAEQRREELVPSMRSLRDVPHAQANACQFAHVAFHLQRLEATDVPLDILSPLASGLIERNRGLLHGPADLYIGMLLSLQGNIAEALQHLERAEHAARTLGSPVWRARALHAAAVVCERAGGAYTQRRASLEKQCRAETQRVNMRCLFARHGAPRAESHAGAHLTLEVQPAGARLLATFADGQFFEVALGERAADLLLMLAQPPAEQAGGYVPDEALLSRIWPRQDKSRVDLNVLVHRTRQALERAAIPLVIVRQHGGTRLSLPGGSTLEIRT